MNPSGTETDVPDIKDILPPEPLTNHWPWIIGIAVAVLVLLAVGALLYYFWRRDQNRPRHVMTPQQIALKKLREIAARAPELTPNAFSLQVSDTLKDYLGARFGDPLRYETSEEFITRLSTSADAKLPESKRDLVAGFVQISDEIKFGRPPDAEEKKPVLMQQAQAVVEDQIEVTAH